ncbi:aspartate/glutamate racemase family protein [Catenisphaera adipataccumulans]|uniref:Aspartate racemase n=1 Tax=Catenisphaera adipataccumulans TaxID=700500 RepID=A0A7W8CX99_9FIRM|nr:amino acid racemase [Catenisphaera adipataccumulans]MBB5182639.1 aspartate racemase [Catenisphaera adipataccumulans]
MKKLGLIGGTGPESTLIYYKNIEQGVQKKIGKPYFPPMTIESLSVFEVLRYCDTGDYQGLTEYLVQGFQALAAAGCDFGAFTGITPHIVIDKVKEKSPIPIVSMIDTAADDALMKGYTNVGLIGTYPTMSGHFFQENFKKKGIQVVCPHEDEMRLIGNKIETELEYGKVIPETRDRVIEIVRRMQEEEHIQAVVLGCTELPLLFKEAKCPVETIDVLAVHLEALIRMILEQQKME